MTAAEAILDHVSISAVWRALGGGELRHGRGRAFWRRHGVAGPAGGSAMAGQTKSEQVSICSRGK